MKKPIKALDAVKQWFKKNCKKGDLVEISSSDKVLMISKVAYFTYSYKDEKTKKQ